MILIIDNYDSFVHNLARYVREAGEQAVTVRRNDMLGVADCLAMAPAGIILSPGPGRPADAGVCIDLVRAAPEIPMLGVCLGHQAIAEAYGGRTVRSREPMHGRASPVSHDASGLLAGLPSPFSAGRYHSLSTDITGCADIQVQARAPDGEIMALRHVRYPHHGVQFHPESLLTTGGRDIVGRFVALCPARQRASEGVA